MAEMEAYGFRAADEYECLVGSGQNCALNCYDALDDPQAENFTIYSDEGAVAMFGVTPLNVAGMEPGWGVIWFLSTDRMYRLKRQFRSQNLIWIEHMHRFYPHMMNYVHHANTVGQQWCKELGFTFHQLEPFGVKGELFWLITRSTKDV